VGEEGEGGGGAERQSGRERAVFKRGHHNLVQIYCIVDYRNNKAINEYYRRCMTIEDDYIDLLVALLENWVKPYCTITLVKLHQPTI
jgi:hypothetical protein